VRVFKNSTAETARQAMPWEIDRLFAGGKRGPKSARMEIFRGSRFAALRP